MYYAKLDENNVVTQVIVADQAFINTQFGNFVRTDFTGQSPKNFAGIGHTYDAHRNAFIPQKPYASWTLDEETCQWIAPVSMPDDGKTYRWDEESQAWVRP